MLLTPTNRRNGVHVGNRALYSKSSRSKLKYKKDFVTVTVIGSFTLMGIHDKTEPQLKQQYEIHDELTCGTWGCPTRPAPPPTMRGGVRPAATNAGLTPFPKAPLAIKAASNLCVCTDREGLLESSQHCDSNNTYTTSVLPCQHWPARKRQQQDVTWYSYRLTDRKSVTQTDSTHAAEHGCKRCKEKKLHYAGLKPVKSTFLR